MPCDACGHSKAAHKEMTLAVYFCNECQKIESYVSFPPDRVASGDTKPDPDDMLSKLYYEHKAFRKD